MIPAFTFARIPRIVFGPGEIGRVDRCLPSGCRTVLVVTGGSSLDRSGAWERLVRSLTDGGVEPVRVNVEGEPSPELVNRAVREHRPRGVDAVLAVGGGSVLDAGKAISAMLPHGDPVEHYLEGVGDREHDGEKVPFVAAPTTSGTGSEATKNAVLSRVGEQGYKKSLRHDGLVPDVAVVDPELILSCPASVTAACGMDALTQLLESYVSLRASPMTDALALSGMEHLRDSLVPLCTAEPGDLGRRSAMAYAALLSGITLANAGLGVVHGLASPLGGRFPAPHGVVCGTLLGAATRANIEALREQGEAGLPALRKYARAGTHLTAEPNRDEACRTLAELLVERIEVWTETLGLPRLGAYGVTEHDLDRIVDRTGLKNNPVPLDQDRIRAVLRSRL